LRPDLPEKDQAIFGRAWHNRLKRNTGSWQGGLVAWKHDLCRGSKASGEMAEGNWGKMVRE